MNYKFFIFKPNFIKSISDIDLSMKQPLKPYKNANIMYIDSLKTLAFINNDFDNSKLTPQELLLKFQPLVIGETSMGNITVPSEKTTINYQGVMCTELYLNFTVPKDKYTVDDLDRIYVINTHNKNLIGRLDFGRMIANNIFFADDISFTIQNSELNSYYVLTGKVYIMGVYDFPFNQTLAQISVDYNISQ